MDGLAQGRRYRDREVPVKRIAYALLAKILLTSVDGWMIFEGSLQQPVELICHCAWGSSARRKKGMDFANWAKDGRGSHKYLVNTLDTVYQMVSDQHLVVLLSEGDAVVLSIALAASSNLICSS